MTARRGVRVLGMHRGGTSFTAGLFTAAGYCAGLPTSLMSGDQWNAPGYFERVDVQELNDTVLESLSASWSAPPAPADVSHCPRSLVARCAALFERVVAEAGGHPIVLKDPRIGVLMPLWNEVLGDDLLDVIVLRNPLAVARSIERRDGMPVQVGLALWEVYFTSILSNLGGRPVAVINYDGIASYLGGETRRDSAGAPADDGGLGALDEFLARYGLPAAGAGARTFDESNHRHAPTESDFELYASASQQRLWRTLSELPPTSDHFAVPSWVGPGAPAISAELVAAADAWVTSLLGEIRWLRSENTRVALELQRLYRSSSWRMTAPVRRFFGMRWRKDFRRAINRASSVLRRESSARIVTGRPAPDTSALGSGNHRVCAVVHAYYPELLPEIVRYLARCEGLTEVIVTHPPHVPQGDIEASLAVLRSRGVHVRVREVENRGRDVWPFLQVLDDALSTDCEVFIKVHTKRTPKAVGGFGDHWRIELLDGLLPGRDEIGSMVRFLATATTPGYVAPASRAVRLQRRDRNIPGVRRLCKRGHLRFHRTALFPAGTMYWCGRNWLEFLRGLGLSRDDFEPEPLAADGTLAHAIERLIGFFCADRQAQVWHTDSTPSIGAVQRDPARSRSASGQ